MRVGLDLDGVCYDFGSALRDWLRARGWESSLPEPQTWYFYRAWGLTDQEFGEQVNAGVAAGWIFRNGEPLRWSLEGAKALKADGHTIHVVTDRFFGPAGDAQAATVEWLTRWGFPYDSVTFSKDKTVVRLDAMVDDRLENYDALEAAGVEAYLLDQQWNREIGDDRRRVKTVYDFALALREREAAA